MMGQVFLLFITGLFFVTTGYRKVFLPDVRAKVFGLFAKYGVPKPAGWAVVLGEFMGGLAMVAGIPLALIAPVSWVGPIVGLTYLAAALLLPIMVGAICMSVLPPLLNNWRKTQAPFSQRLSNFLCTPEVQLFNILLALVISYIFG